MFVVPVGALFAFTTIRAAFPGAPSGFGEIHIYIDSFVPYINPLSDRRNDWYRYSIFIIVIKSEQKK